MLCEIVSTAPFLGRSWFWSLRTFDAGVLSGKSPLGERSWEQPLLQTAAGASQVWGSPAHMEETQQHLGDRMQDLLRTSGSLGLGVLATVCSGGQRSAQRPGTGAPRHPKARLSLPLPTGLPAFDLTLGEPRALEIKPTLEKQQGPVANSSSACGPVPQAPDFSKTDKDLLELCVHQGSGHLTVAV